MVERRAKTYDPTMRLLGTIGLLFFAGAVAGACGSSGPSGFDGGLDSPSGDTNSGCAPGQTSCGGTCTDLQSDPYNCGVCANACQGGDLCCSGKCVKSSGCDFAVTSVTPQRGNQSGGDWVQLKGAGFVAGMEVFIGTGRAPVHVIDAQNALIQTPPGPVGYYDITLVETQGSSLTRSAFQYVSGQLQLPWQKDPMQVIRGEMPAIAVMQDGRVLVAGGTTVPDNGTMGLTTAEIFTRGDSQNPDTVTLANGTMQIKRWHDAAVTMFDGRVVVAGGSDCGTDNCALADIFDPKTSSFSPAANPMTAARSYMHGVLMVDGRVMLTSAGATTSEIFDPSNDTFSSVPLVQAHAYGHQLVRLRDGRVMLMGGSSSSCTVAAQSDVEIFDVATNTWTAAASMKAGRGMFTAHTLPDGRVMVFGGSSDSAGGVCNPMNEIEAYDPSQDTWTVMPYTLSVGRTWHASALVRDGTILVMGGYTQNTSCAPSDSVDQVDPVAGTVAPFGTLPDPNTEWNAVTLLDGSVLGVGGGACGGVALPDLDFLPGVPLPN
jgi:hypothetical protein